MAPESFKLFPINLQLACRNLLGGRPWKSQAQFSGKRTQARRIESPHVLNQHIPVSHSLFDRHSVEISPQTIEFVAPGSRERAGDQHERHADTGNIDEK